MIAKPPHIRLLEAIYATLKAFDFEAATGIPGVTIRHFRNRNPKKGEKPCISIRWMGNEDARVDGQYRNEWERVKNCNVDLQVDMALPPESAAPADQDETGWALPSILAAAAFGALRAEGSPMAAVSDWVQESDTDPDEDSTADEGRLVQAIVVVYRVYSEDPNRLLAAGEQG